jgi:hypothetical protein
MPEVDLPYKAFLPYFYEITMKQSRFEEADQLSALESLA